MEDPQSSNPEEHNYHLKVHYNSDTSISTSGTRPWHPQQWLINSLPPPAPVGTLLHHHPPTSDNTQDDDALHILHWLDIIDEGPTSFEQEIAQNLHNTNATPTLFAILPTWSDCIKVAHGFKGMILSTNWHWANGHIRFFLSDCIAVHLAAGCQLQDPHLIITCNFITLLDTFTGIPASDQTISNSNAPLVPSYGCGQQILIPKLFPIPHAWWTTFLHRTTSPQDALRFINWITCNWLEQQ